MHPKMEQPISQEVLHNSALMMAKARNVGSRTNETRQRRNSLLALSPGFMVWDKLAGLVGWHILTEIVKINLVQAVLI
jgi:hypothetical protein